MKERKIFDKQFVHFMWDDSLEGKKGFATDNIDALQDGVEGNLSLHRYTASGPGTNMYPLEMTTGDCFRFFYYDPLYDVKWAWKQGKVIQFRNKGSDSWIDTNSPSWIDRCEYRVKPEEKKYRPFKDVDELKHTWFAKHFSSLPHNIITEQFSLEEPMIWVRSKSNTTSTYLITHYCGNEGVVYLCGYLNMSLEQLFDDYTFLDGTPCGVKE